MRPTANLKNPDLKGLDGVSHKNGIAGRDCVAGTASAVLLTPHVVFGADLDGLPTTSPGEIPADERSLAIPSKLSLNRLGRLHETMADYVDRGELPGLVTAVSAGDETHIEALGKLGFGVDDRMRRDSIFRIASMTKPITAAAAMILVEECRLRLDDPVDAWLPELADRRVLRSIESPIDDTVPATRPISLRDLLTLRLGIGAVMATPGTYPIQSAMEDAGLAPGPDLLTLSSDELMARLGTLPLICQPGEQWLYHTGSEVLGVLIERVLGQSLGEFLRERLFGPLGMKDTGFWVLPSDVCRLSISYRRDRESGGMVVYDEGSGGRFTQPPDFESGGGGLVSTADDYLAFCRMMLNKGVHNGEMILSRPTVELMTENHLTPEQSASSPLFFDGHGGWGFGMAVNTRRTHLHTMPGRFGWDGGYGTSAYTDPSEDLIGILLTQVMMESPQPPPVYRDFWTSVYQAVPAR